MERKGFIGGSDCTKIIEGYWLELWKVKTGREEPESLVFNLPVQLGRHTEDFNLKWFAANEGKQVVAQQREFTGTVGTVPVKGTIDGAIKDERNIIEAKHTNRFYNMDKMLDRYMPQLQFYCHMAKAEGVYLSVIFGNSDWECIHVKYNEEYFNSMWAVVSDFWGYVLRDEQPVGNEATRLSRLSIPLDDMETRDASLDNAFVDAAVTYIHGYEQNKVFKNAEKDLKQMVSDNEREVYCDQLTVKRDKRGHLRITRRTK